MYTVSNVSPDTDMKFLFKNQIKMFDHNLTIVITINNMLRLMLCMKILFGFGCLHNKQPDPFFLFNERVRELNKTH